MKVKYSGIEMRDQRTRGGRGRYPILCQAYTVYMYFSILLNQYITLIYLVGLIFSWMYKKKFSAYFSYGDAIHYMTCICIAFECSLSKIKGGWRQGAYQFF